MKKHFGIFTAVITLLFFGTDLLSQGTNTPCSGGGGGSPAATVLTVGSSCSYVGGTTVGATYASTAANGGTPSCASPGAPDVWFRFVAPATGNVTIDLTSGTMTDSGMSLYSGTCGSFSELTCDDDGGAGTMSQIVANGLTPGTTYYIRVWEYSSGEGTFNICVSENAASPGAPANDNCSGAVNLTVNPDLNCGSTTAGTIENATGSSQSTAACGGTEDDDVWYTFTATSSTHIISLINITGSTSDLYHSVWSGTCPSLSLVAGTCSDPETSTVTGLTIGNTYYVRVYSWTSTTGQTSDFNICIGTPPPPPANDDPCNATVLTVNTSCSYTTGTNASATSSSGVPAPGCAGYNGGDVWYRITVPASGNLIFDTDDGGITDGGMAIYSGNCNSLTLIDCDDDNSTNGAMPMITNSGLTPGSTIWIRVWENWDDTEGTFSICVVDAGVPPPGSSCGNATVISALPYSSTGQTTCGFGDDYDSGDACFSSYMNGDDYVYSYTPSSNQSVNVTLTNTGTFTGVFIVNGCPTTGSCVASNTNSSGNPSLSCVSLTAGVTYYIIVSTYPSPQCGAFDINMTLDATAPSCNLNYSVSSIAHSSTGGGGWTSLNFSDDRFADSYTNIGFTFCFDGAQYTQTLVSSNGYIIFPGCATVVPGGSATPTGTSPWDIDLNIPNTTDAPRNAILLTYHDIDPNYGGTIRYKTTGTTPNRIFTLQYNAVPMFDSDCNGVASLDYTGELRLYETSNNIEFAITNKQICSVWNDGGAISGLHNSSGTVAVLPPGNHNFTPTWTETNAGYRFVPNCASCTTPLGIEWIQLTVTNLDSYNKLEWMKVTNTEISEFIIEKSTNGGDFYEIGKINNDIHAENDFIFIDEKPNFINYYRVKSIDIDGNSIYSSILKIMNDGIEFDNIWPNPHEEKFNFTISSSIEDEFELEITDISGRIMSKRKLAVLKGDNTFEVSTEGIASGFYHINLRNNEGNLLKSKNILKY